MSERIVDYSTTGLARRYRRVIRVWPLFCGVVAAVVAIIFGSIASWLGLPGWGVLVWLAAVTVGGAILVCIDGWEWFGGGLASGVPVYCIARIAYAVLQWRGC